MTRKKILISVYAGVTNKGTEALLRGLAEILYKKFEDNIELNMCSLQPHIDKFHNLPYYKNFYFRDITAIPHIGRMLDFILRIFNKIGAHDLAFKLRYLPYYNAVKKNDLLIVMGADNYDVEYGKGYLHLYKFHEWLSQKLKTKKILYDCSLNKESVTPDFLHEIEQFEFITIRESESLQNLKTLYKGEKVYYCPDPAFIMPQKEIKLPTIFTTNNCVGINLSNLIIRNDYGKFARQNAFKNYYYLIDSILEKTNYAIVLIPHVMNNADLSVLKELYRKYIGNPKVYLIDNENLSATELKYIISKLKFLVTARTHASIAAYSTYVPTLVLGYSVKSRGIAKDLFGNIDNYVVPIQNLTNEETLWIKFKWILDNEENIKSHLKKILPEYQEESKKIGDLIKKIL